MVELKEINKVTNSIIVLSPDISEDSAKHLAEALGAKWENPYKTENRDFSKYDLIFKYGFSKAIKKKPIIGKVLNKTEATNIAMDKIAVFKVLEKEKITVPFTVDKDVARQWFKKGNVVVARSLVKGANGAGLVYCETEQKLENTEAIFWTKYIEHTNEFRVNIWRNKVISIYDKKRKPHKGEKTELFDFILYKGQENHPQLVNMVQKVWENIGLDWCGIDILCTKGGELILLEINSAPILYPHTLKILTSLVRKELV